MKRAQFIFLAVLAALVALTAIVVAADTYQYCRDKGYSALMCLDSDSAMFIRLFE